MSSVQECDKLAKRLFGLNSRVLFEEHRPEPDPEKPLAVNIPDGIRACVVAHISTNPHQITARVDGDWVMFDGARRTNENAGSFEVAALSNLAGKLQGAIDDEELAAARARVARAAPVAAPVAVQADEVAPERPESGEGA